MSSEPHRDPRSVGGKRQTVRNSANNLIHFTAQAALKSKDVRVRRVLKLLDANPALRLPTLARHVHLSQSRLEFIFKMSTGQTLASYVLAVRLAHAASLLQQSGLHVKEVASKAGYSHATSFVRAFKRHFGIKPRAYRLKNRARRPQ